MKVTTTHLILVFYFFTEDKSSSKFLRSDTAFILFKIHCKKLKFPKHRKFKMFSCMVAH